MTMRFLSTVFLPFSSAILVLPDRPPRGFNTFDSYEFDQVNESLVLALADAMAAQLLPHGYEFLVVDGGWTESRHPNGTRFEHIDSFGRPIAAPERYPTGMAWLGDQVRRRGLKFGLWTIRGVHVDAVRRRLPVLGASEHTVDQIVDVEPVGGGPNGSCLWQPNYLGVNMSHPAAQAYYESRVALLAVDYKVDFIKADCMMCGPCYTDEVQAFSAAVRASPRALVLSYSPGGGNSVHDGCVQRALKLREHLSLQAAYSPREHLSLLAAYSPRRPACLHCCLPRRPACLHCCLPPLLLASAESPQVRFALRAVSGWLGSAWRRMSRAVA